MAHGNRSAMDLVNPVEVGVRDSWMDNAKFGLIVLVVVGHFLEIFKETHPSVRVAWQFIYVIHIPAFVFICGYFSKPFRAGQLRKSAENTLVPLLVYSVAIEAVITFLTGQPSRYFYEFAPYWVLWFLLSLFCWQALLPHVSKLRFVLAVSLALAVVAGLFGTLGYEFSLSRTIYFFPFFLMGYLSSKHDLFNKVDIRHPKFIVAAAVVMLTLLLVVSLWPFPDSLLLGARSFNESHVDPQIGLLLRSFLLTLSTLGCFAFLALMPHRKTIVSTLGSNSICIFVFHAPAVDIFRYCAADNFRALSDPILIALALTFGAVLCVVLGSHFVKDLHGRLMGFFIKLIPHG
jgi:fucose 4-O-acetylase-like acetyltransferase